ncbi:MAG TPA: hypothetical protein VGW38_29115 [Chloroflexota bacterium]|nr:hypothetical protein [Chloroflexota bacterium]
MGVPLHGSPLALVPWHRRPSIVLSPSFLALRHLVFAVADKLYNLAQGHPALRAVDRGVLRVIIARVFRRTDDDRTASPTRAAMFPRHRRIGRF